MVLMDVETGAIVAVVNYPTWDPARLRGGGKDAHMYFEQLKADDERFKGGQYWLRRSPMLNRAASGRYMPGSTFKILSSIAMLESGTINENSTYAELEREYRGRGFVLKTNHVAGRAVNIVGAIETSVNGFYWYFSERMPGASPQERFENVLKPWAMELGFGVEPGLDLSSQTAGSLPDASTVYGGELANLSIGQGQLLASPIQVTRLMCAVATGGKLPTPHFCAEGEFAVRELDVSPKTWSLVADGMRRVVHGAYGTANKSKICRDVKIAAKTGTAQNGNFRAADGNIHHVPDHAWFAGYAPCDKPKYAFCVLAEYSGLFGGDLADMAGEVVEFALKRHNTASSEAAPAAVNK